MLVEVAERVREGEVVVDLPELRGGDVVEALDRVPAAARSRESDGAVMEYAVKSAGVVLRLSFT